MKILTAVLITLLLAVPLVVFADESSKPKVVSGEVSLSGKYESNVDLASGNIPEGLDEDAEIEDAYITEVTALLQFTSPWTSGWHLSLELYGLTDLHLEVFEDSWLIGRANLYLGYSFGANTISLQNEAKYFSEPDDPQFDFFRNQPSLVFKRVFSDLWQGRIGYRNNINLYPENRCFDFMENGSFAEIRNTWNFKFSTYYNYEFLYYQGGNGTCDEFDFYSPESGMRHSGEIGFEAFFAKKNSLIGAYTYRYDDKTGEGVDVIGENLGEDENLELEAEFSYIKHEGMVLYSHRFNDRFSLSLYNELIHKTFLEEGTPYYQYDKDRIDLLYMGSFWATARLVDELYAKTRYIFRMSDSTIKFHDFTDHIVSLGLEYRF